MTQYGVIAMVRKKFAFSTLLILIVAGNDELNIDDMFKRTVQEVDSLKERLGQTFIINTPSKINE